MGVEHWTECEGMRWINSKTRLARYPERYRVEQAWSGGIDSIALTVEELELLANSILDELEGIVDIGH